MNTRLSQTLEDFLPPAARPGDAIAQLDTPALLLDLDAFERNLARMQAAADAAGLALRPHAKAHKCVAIALAQLRAGAAGICCQKVSEAIPFVLAGIKDILIANEIASPAKAAVLARLAQQPGMRLSVCVDHEQQIAWLAQACAEAGSRLELLVDLNVGQNRCGVEDAQAVRQLVAQIGRHPAQLRFKGLQAYQGGMQHLRGPDERRAAAQAAAGRVRAVRDALLAQAEPIVCDTITGGGTGSAAFDLHSGVFTEIQPGSYVFMDADYGRNQPGPEDQAQQLRFEHSLLLATTVMSQGHGERVVLDAGLKSLAVDSGLPRVWDAALGRFSSELDYVAANDEHGLLQLLPGAAARPALGAQVLLVPGHCDPTLNLHEAIVTQRAGRVEGIWAIEARGLSR